jgi:hypothetical protein
MHAIVLKWPEIAPIFILSSIGLSKVAYPLNPDKG